MSPKYFDVALMRRAAEVMAEPVSAEIKRQNLEQVWADGVHQFLSKHGCLCQTDGCFAKLARTVQIELTAKAPFSWSVFLSIIEEGLKNFACLNDSEPFT